NNAYILLILLIEPILFKGKRTIRDCSANAERIDWRIHHTAYEINLNPRVSSKRCAALIKPKFPSLIKSGKVKPWFWYCLATDTTKRKLAFVNFSSALWSPALMRCANSTSSSAVIKSTLPISCKYLSNDAVSLLVTCLVILSCLIYNTPSFVVYHSYTHKAMKGYIKVSKFLFIRIYSDVKRIIHWKFHPIFKSRVATYNAIRNSKPYVCH